MAELWPHMSIDRRRAAIVSVVETVAIKERTIKQARFDPGRVEVVIREGAPDSFAQLAVLVGGGQRWRYALARLSEPDDT